MLHAVVKKYVNFWKKYITPLKDDLIQYIRESIQRELELKKSLKALTTEFNMWRTISLMLKTKYRP